MEVSDAKRLRALDDENGKLKRLLEDAVLDVGTERDSEGALGRAA